nr:hypothetical protein [uncultured Actinomyces sp.]
MRFEDKITVELNQMDAAIAAVLLAENAGQLALKALLADKTAEVGGTANKDTRALADAYIKVGNALTFAIMGASKNRGLQSTGTLHRSVALAGVAAEVAAVAATATEARGEQA